LRKRVAGYLQVFFVLNPQPREAFLVRVEHLADARSVVANHRGAGGAQHRGLQVSAEHQLLAARLHGRIGGIYLAPRKRARAEIVSDVLASDAVRTHVQHDLVQRNRDRTPVARVIRVDVYG